MPPGDPKPVKLMPNGFEASRRWAGHPPSQSMDGNLRTKWYTGHGKAIGHQLKLAFREAQTLTKVSIYNPENEEVRLKEATLLFSDGSQQIAKFRGLNGWEHFEIKPVRTDSLIVEAKEVYPPSANYMVICELELICY